MGSSAAAPAAARPPTAAPARAAVHGSCKRKQIEWGATYEILVKSASQLISSNTVCVCVRRAVVAQSLLAARIRRWAAKQLLFSLHHLWSAQLLNVCVLLPAAFATFPYSAGSISCSSCTFFFNFFYPLSDPLARSAALLRCLAVRAAAAARAGTRDHEYRYRGTTVLACDAIVR